MTSFYTLRFRKGDQVLYAAHNDGTPIVWRVTPNPQEACHVRSLAVVRRLLRGPKVFQDLLSASNWEIVSSSERVVEVGSTGVRIRHSGSNRLRRNQAGTGTT